MNVHKELGQIIEDEGLRLEPYRCSEGFLTIGIGRNLDANGISEQEAVFMASNDLEAIKLELYVAFPWLKNKPEEAQLILANMAFNLGINGLSKFKKTLMLVGLGDYKKASLEMLDSLWAKQVGERARRLSRRMAAIR